MPRIVDKEEKRDDILQAALKVFARQGVYRFKMIDIAEEAAVGKGTLYEYFSTKEELIGASFRQFLEEYEKFVLDRVQLAAGPVESVRTYFRAALQFFEQEPERLHLFLDLWSGGVAGREPNSVMAEMTEVYLRAREDLSAKIARAQAESRIPTRDPALSASALLALMDGVLFQAALGVTPLNSKTAGVLEEILMKGIEG